MSKMRVIDLLKEVDKNKLASMFIAKDLFVMMMANLTLDETIGFITDMCCLEKELEKPNYIAFEHKIFSEKGLDKRFLFFGFNTDIDEGVCIKNMMEIPHKALLGSFVSDKIANDKNCMDFLVNVLHSAFCDIFHAELFDKIDDDIEDVGNVENIENTIVVDLEDVQLSDEEKEALLVIRKMLENLDRKLLLGEVKNLLNELEVDFDIYTDFSIKGPNL